MYVINVYTMSRLEPYHKFAELSNKITLLEPILVPRRLLLLPLYLVGSIILESPAMPGKDSALHIIIIRCSLVSTRADIRPGHRMISRETECG